MRLETSGADGHLSRGVTQLVESNGGTTSWTYDDLDRQKTMVFNDLSTRQYTYDLANDLIGYIDENQSSFAHTFDVLGRRTATAIIPATSVVGTTAQSFQYDGAGRMTFARDTVGTTNTDATFAYDSLGRTVEEVQTYGTDHRYVTHDQFTGYTATDLTYPSGRQVASGYDPLYRRNAITEVTGGTSIAQWYFYGDRVATVVLGNGQTVSMMNNAQTHSAVQPTVANPPWNSSSPTPMDDRLGYDGSGRMITKRYVQSAGSTSAALVVGYTTAYDASGNKFYERALHAPDRSALYDQYDSMDRLADYQRGTLAVGGGSVTPSTMSLINSQQSYNLDALGNWTSTTYTPVGSASTTQMRVHNLLNEVTSYGSTPTPVLYDHGSNSGSSASQGNGNIVDDGVRTLAYDALNRVVTVSRKTTGTPLLVATYTYDALGRRTRKVVANGGVTGPANPVADSTFRYLYDGRQIVEELNASNTTVRQEVWGQYIDELIQLQVAGGTYVFYPLSDLLYRTIAITDPTGAIKQVYDTDAYGNTLIFESGGGTGGAWFSDNDVTTYQPACETIFTGRLYDPETQLYWYRAR